MESTVPPTMDATPPAMTTPGSTTTTGATTPGAAEPPTPRWMRWTGWAISALVFLMMGPPALFMANNEQMRKGMAEMGYPAGSVLPIVLAEVAAAVLYVVPRTATLGAVLIVGYLGGAVATHVRAGDGLWFVPVLFGVVAGLGLWLRDARVRAVLPWRRG